LKKGFFSFTWIPHNVDFYKKATYLILYPRGSNKLNSNVGNLMRKSDICLRSFNEGTAYAQKILTIVSGTCKVIRVAARYFYLVTGTKTLFGTFI